jgi:hypothetical protein
MLQAAVAAYKNLLHRMFAVGGAAVWTAIAHKNLLHRMQEYFYMPPLRHIKI